MLANLRALFGVIVDIILLRRGPDSVPASTALLTATVVFYVGVTALVANWFAANDPNWPLELAMGIVLPMLWYRVALTVAGKRERFVQMMTAMFAVQALFTPIMVPMMATVTKFAAAKPDAPPEPSLIPILFLFLVVWQFIVSVRIVRATFEWPTVGAVAMVIAQQLAVFTVYALVFMQAPPAA